MTTWLVWTFPIFAIWGIFCAYTLKIRFSGSTYFIAKFLSCLLYNGFFATTYLDIIKEDNYLVLGHKPEILINHPFVGWIAFLCIPIHAAALPVRREIKWWF